MNFSENLQMLRKNRAMTQEQLAEQLEISRQAVSKWESGQSYPEMDKLIQLCELFHCDLNTLVSGRVDSAAVEDASAYDSHKNSFAKAMASATALLMIGVSAMLFLTGLIPQALAVVVLLLCITVSISIYIVYGIRDDHFKKEHPHIEDCYTNEQRRQIKNRFTTGMTVGVALILAGVIVLVALTMLPIAQTIPPAVLLLFAAAGMWSLIYFGVQKDKYDIEKYNTEAETVKKATGPNPADRFAAPIMLTAIAAFLVMGFAFGLWHPGWVVFPVGALFCGIAASLQKKNDSDSGKSSGDNGDQ